MSSLSLLLGEADHGDEERVEPKLRRAWWWERAKEGWQPGCAISRRPFGSIEVRHDLQLDRITSVLIATSISYDSRHTTRPKKPAKFWEVVGHGSAVGPPFCLNDRKAHSNQEQIRSLSLHTAELLICFRSKGRRGVATL